MPVYKIVFQQFGCSPTDFQSCNIRKHSDAAAWDGFIEFVHAAEKDSKKVYVLEMVRFREIGNASGLEIELVATNPHLPQSLIDNRRIRLSRVVRREMAIRWIARKLEKAKEWLPWLEEFIGDAKLFGFIEFFEPLTQAP
ncbi:MAG: hypothetical protein ABSF47_03905 [Minisyncoccia bacterium]